MEGKAEASKMTGSEMICLGCEKVVNLNSMGLCVPCRTSTCKKCGKEFKFSKDRSDHCSQCRLKRRKQLSRHQDF